MNLKTSEELDQVEFLDRDEFHLNKYIDNLDHNDYLMLLLTFKSFMKNL